MVDISEVSTIIAAVSVVIGVFFTVVELRAMTRTRRTDLIMRMYEKMINKEFMEVVLKLVNAKFASFEEYSKNYSLAEASQVASTFEGIGILLEQKLIDVALVDHLFGEMTETVWSKMNPIIYGTRKQLGQPYLFGHFEYLYNRMRVYRASEQWIKDHKQWVDYGKRYGFRLGKVPEKQQSAN